MRPIQTDDQNAVLKLEGGTEANDLPCKVADGWTISTWRPSDDERAKVLENGLVVVWLWWTNLLGVQLRVDGATAPDEPARHTSESMAFSGILRDDTSDDPGGPRFYSLMATLDERELIAVRDGANFELRVDMHPTCPCSVSAAEFESQ
jgi:hypothetical protein